MWKTVKEKDVFPVQNALHNQKKFQILGELHFPLLHLLTLLPPQLPRSPSEMSVSQC